MATRFPQVVAFGGGHGLAASLGALRLITEDLTAVVTVADNGGSSGRLRSDFGVLPPGDLRMALSALCDDTEWGHAWAEVMQHRFTGEGGLAGHPLGNLLIISLWQLHDDPVRGLDLVGRLLGARGRVLPMSAVPLDLEARVRGADPSAPEEERVVRGQVEIAGTEGSVESISVLPENPPVRSEVLHAVADADWIVLGPGSWYTSVLIHLLVEDLREALLVTKARRLLTLNLEMSTTETSGFSAVKHLATLRATVPGLRLDAVLADPSVVDDRIGLERACGDLGAELIVQPVSRPGRAGEHDTLRLAAAYRDILQ